MKRLNSKSGCAVEVTLSVMGGTWKPIILFHLLHGKKRFSELSKSIGSITQRMLTLQLRELEDAGIVLRTVYAEVPPRVDYELTALGQSLKPVLIAMRTWGTAYAKDRLYDAQPPSWAQLCASDTPHSIPLQ
ncbi:helix-turn-helix transcriptional regulator [Lampropedia puyangensis]|uniref:Helix-turn-helix transcriptional regulator n=2 Tax=Lampropedia puyangensis TaxID=1330072 RepID=A0A4S8FDG6_9BURK|nr:helix-turn-helix transcriptional regulator [Lampropedia puyangensis]